jgi:membrane-bound metal-dependent hydrolase YbcI (DUF457 family)
VSSPEEGNVTEDDAQDRRSRALVRGLRSTVGRESTTFGFSILVTVTFGLLQTVQGSPDVARVFLFATGAVMSFTLLEAVMSRGFRRPMPQHGTHVQAVGTSLNLLSVLAGLGSAWLLAAVVSHVSVWALAPFLAGLVYLFMESVETTFAERLLVSRGEHGARDVSP